MKSLPYSEPEMPPWWDTGVILLTIASIVLIVLDLSGALLLNGAWLIEPLDLGFCAVFFFDFLWRMKRASHWLTFLRRNWIDLVAALPAIDILRVGRVVRLVRLMRTLVLMRRLFRYLNLPPSTIAIGYVGLLTLSIWFLAGSIFYFFESGSNENVRGFDDALWWSITTLSTVGYGDISPTTGAGRFVAALTMVLGIGLLASFAGAISNIFIEARELKQRGLRGYKMKEHFLILGWNDKAKVAIEHLCHDTRYRDAKLVIVADLESSPLDEPRAHFVRGRPGSRESLNRASADQASVAIILSSAPTDPRSDYETALTALTLRRLNAKVRISAELVDPVNKEHLEHAGCDAVIEPLSLAASLLVRGVLDVGTSHLIWEILSANFGANLQRVSIDAEFLHKPYREFLHAMIERSITVLGIARGADILVQPDHKTLLEESDEVFIISHP